MQPKLIIGSLLVTGLLGSLGHCSGMCGPLVIMVGTRLGDARWPARLGLYMLYHSGRVLIYMLLAALLGAFGNLLGAGSKMSPLGGWVSLVLGIGVIIFSLGYLGILPIERFMDSGVWLSRQMKQTLKRGRTSGMLLMGILNGLLPCGLVYSALLTAASLGSPAKAALGMGAFGLGTWPVLLMIGLGATGLSLTFRYRLARLAGLFILLVGVQLCLRGMASLGWIHHLHLAGWMLW
ncbi:MAG: sulfite exporter TauE/SafE family protein [Anaerolineales bacterium]